MKRLNVLLITAMTFILNGCASENPGLTMAEPPPPAAIERDSVTQKGKGLQVTYDTRVDILFVIDDSQSMRNHQKKLSQNIKRFVDEIAKVESIDFHIGFTVVHDSLRYGAIVPPSCEVDGQLRTNWSTPGSLQPLLGPADKLPKDGRRFVTREDDFAAILRDSLDPDKNLSLVKNLVNKTADKPDVCPYGPEEEEVFTPLLGALEDSSVLNTTNKGFRREGAFCVAIRIPDAKSADVVSKGLYPDVVKERLKQATGEEAAGKKKFRVFSVVMKPGTRIDRNQCWPDPAFVKERKRIVRADGSVVYQNTYPDVITDNPLSLLAELTQEPNERGSLDQVLSICDNDYGTALAKYGTQIKQDALTDVVLDLPSRPQVFTDPADQNRNLSVWINDTELKSADGLWDYDKQNVRVIVYGQKVDWDQFPEANIRVEYVPVDPTASTTKPIGWTAAE